MKLDPEVAALINALPEEARSMVGIVFEDVSSGELEPEEGLESILAIIEEYKGQLTQ